MIEGLYINPLRVSRLTGEPPRLLQKGTKIWGNLISNDYFHNVASSSEDAIKRYGWIKVGEKIMVMWDD